MVRPHLTIVIPCHNEAETIGAVVAGAAQFGEVLVVDDRSTDLSRHVAEAAGAVVMPSPEPGYDGAILAGLRRAFGGSAAFVVTMDADGEHDPALVESFAQRLSAGAGLVCGKRPRPQRLAEHLAAIVGRRLFGVEDLLCGMKGYSRELLDDYFASGAPLLVNMAPAVLWLKRGGAVANVAVTGRRRISGAPRFGRSLAANGTILRALWRALRLKPAGDSCLSPIRAEAGGVAHP